MSSDHAEIQLVPTNPLLDQGGVPNAQIQRYARITFLEHGDDAGEHVDPGRRASPDDERAALEPAEVYDGLLGARQGRE